MLEEIECPIHKSKLVFCELSLEGYDASAEFLLIGDRTSISNQSASMVRDHTDRRKGTYKGSCGCEFIADLTQTYQTERRGNLHEYELGAGDRKVFFPHNN